MTCSLQCLLDGVNGVVSDVADVQVSSMTLDSRKVSEGCLFVALQGTQQHGLSYAQKAESLGAVAVIWAFDESVELPELTIPLIAIKDLPASLGGIAARLYDYPSQDLQIVGITGTDGKTSVSHFLAQAMNARDGSCAVIGTLGIGNPNALEKATHTTPDVITVHESLQRLSKRGSRCVAMEVSSHALDQQRVAGVDFDVAVLTNLTRDHLDYHGTVEAYAEAKAKLFLDHAPKHAVVNLNDAFGERLVAELTNTDTNVIAYAVGEAGQFPETALVASDAKYDHNGLAATLNWQGQQYALKTSVLGDFNLSNLVAVTGCMLALGYTPEQAVASLASLQTVPGRIEKVTDAAVADQDFLAVVDYAHTPGALSSVLNALRVHCSGKLICVFGCGGDRDKGKRPLMAEVAERLADMVIATDDNPRTESAEAIMDDVVAGFAKPDAAVVKHDREAAIQYAISQAQAGDVVLVAGKGHEQVQIVGRDELPFDDREKIREALKTMTKSAANGAAA
ncbi:UDP-N-acetylmuramoyl-L-alanyl-D-glutamate--2,6-diaminopimelate ligase [Leucothrix sargassi]|nr:UDP-N-acetylmuramoyl-L-alanyl-D-glutamate--2,6-diaminopimelate ligase [Leucothrix sargassi]